MSTADGGKPYIPVLDGLRAVSIVLVLVSHALIYDPQAPGVRAAALQCGNVGVSLFFVISGYIITRLLLREEAATGRVRFGRFYLRRAFRLLPACYAYVLVVFALAAARVIPAAPVHDYLASVLYVRNLVGRGHETSHLWSLSLEEQFYLFWPGFLVLLPAAFRLRATFGLIAAVCVWRFALVYLGKASEGALHSRTDLRIDTILFGCALALAARPGGRPAVGWGGTGHGWLAAWVLGLVRWLAAVGRVPHGAAFESGVAAVFLTLVVNWFLRNDGRGAHRVLCAGPFLAVGALSYSLYLWQHLFLGPYDSPIRPLREFPVNLACLFVAAVLSYRLIERPFVRFKDRRLSSLPPDRGTS